MVHIAMLLYTLPIPHDNQPEILLHPKFIEVVQS